MDSTSIQLLQRVQSLNDAEAWIRMVELYTPLLFGWVRQSGYPPADAADIVQDILMTLVKEMPNFTYAPEKGRFRSWLKTVAINRCRTHVRKRRRLLFFSTSNVEDLTERSYIEDFWSKDYERWLLRRAMDIARTEFEEKTWRACFESITSDKGASEIGKELHMSEAAVYVAKSRVLKRLRTELSGLIE
jgi:RNA polymerase sigma-70 factor, ECF subfamily